MPASDRVFEAHHFMKSAMQVAALREELGCRTVADLQGIPFARLRKRWGLNVGSVYHHPTRGNALLEADPFKPWMRGDSAGITIMQGHTANEFRYCITVFGNLEAAYDAVCEGAARALLQKGGKEYARAYAAYEKALRGLGHDGRDIHRAFMDDIGFNSGNVYQAEMHAKNGGRGFFYTFEKGYDGECAHLGAGHAADCFYLFGTFNGESMFGTPEDVQLSRTFQRMIANFCKTGDPSVDGLAWPECNGRTRHRMMIGDNLRVEENPEKARVDAVMQMMDSGGLRRFTGNEAAMLEYAEAINPRAVEECREIWRSRQK